MSIKLISQLSIKDAKLAGGKGAALGELAKMKMNVPSGFVVLADAFNNFLKENNLVVEIEGVLAGIDYKKAETIKKSSDRIRKKILKADMPKDMEAEIEEHFKKLGAKYVAVRSSATAEDSANAAWAGQLESYLNTDGKNLLKNIKKCWASLFEPRAIYYRFEKGLQKHKISVAVVVQKMVKSEKAGVVFSVHPVTQDKNQLIIEAGIGLGEAIVSGKITPDSYVVSKRPKLIIKKITQAKQVLSDNNILKLLELAIKIEKHFKKPQDIEWAYSEGKFYILQSRPITTIK